MAAKRVLLAMACALVVAACDIGSVPPPRFPDASPADAGPDVPDANAPDAAPAAPDAGPMPDPLAAYPDHDRQG